MYLISIEYNNNIYIKYIMNRDGWLFSLFYIIFFFLKVNNGYIMIIYID